MQFRSEVLLTTPCPKPCNTNMRHLRQRFDIFDEDSTYSPNIRPIFDKCFAYSTKIRRIFDNHSTQFRPRFECSTIRIHMWSSGRMNTSNKYGISRRLQWGRSKALGSGKQGLENRVWVSTKIRRRSDTYAANENL